MEHCRLVGNVFRDNFALRASQPHHPASAKGNLVTVTDCFAPEDFVSFGERWLHRDQNQRLSGQKEDFMWFTETPWPPVILLCVVGVLFFVGWLSQRKVVLLFGAIGCLALCGLVFVIEQQIVTEREKVEQQLLDFTAAFQRDSLQQGVGNLLFGGREPECFRFISANAQEVRQLAAQALAIVDIADDVRISDVHTRLTNQESRAITQFRASATVTAGGYHSGGHQPTRWEVTWQREQGTWKIIHVTRLHFMTGQELPNPFITRE
jgi:hypothetical protein